MLENDSTGHAQSGKDFIEHYGRKGMKKYQHKFGPWQKHAQYAGGRDDPNAKPKEDSTVEKVKKKAQAFAESRARKKKLKEAKKQAAETIRKRKAEEQAKKDAEKRAKEAEKLKEEIIKNRDTVSAYKNRDKFTTQELDALINRVNKENTLRDLAVKEQQRKKGKDFTTKAVDLSTKVNKLYSIYNSPAGKALTKSVAKKLGFKPNESFLDKLRKSTSIEDIYKNQDKLSAKEISEAIGRINSKKTLEKMYKEWLEEEKSKKK